MLHGAESPDSPQASSDTTPVEKGSWEGVSLIARWDKSPGSPCVSTDTAGVGASILPSGDENLGSLLSL